MARKKEILTESEIRRFMKLASMAPVGENRLHEMYGDPVHEQEEEEIGGPLDVGMPGEEEVELGAEDALGAEVEDELDVEEPGSAVDEEVAAELAQGFADVMQDVLGVEVSVEGDAGAEDELGVEDELGAEVEDELEPPPGGEELGGLEPEEEELPAGRDLYENEDDLVNEVSKRVAARLAKENKKAKTIDDLTERIFARLTKK